jgi:hypothetical protein
MIISRWNLLRLRNVLDRCCREDQNTHFKFNNFYLKSCRLWDNVENFCIAGIGVCALMLDNYGYRHTLTICNTYCFSSCNDSFANLPQCYVSMYIARLVILSSPLRLSAVCFVYDKLYGSETRSHTWKQGQDWVVTRNCWGEYLDLWGGT